jgi:hypothetical protein
MTTEYEALIKSYINVERESIRKEERQRIKAEYEKELAKFKERIYQFRSKEPGYVFMNATLIEFDTNIKKVFEDGK